MGRGGGVIQNTSASEADTLQAAYFRGLLADERVIVAARLDKERARLATLRETNDEPLLQRHAQLELETTEAEYRNLDRLINDLDRRFLAWPAEG